MVGTVFSRTGLNSYYGTVALVDLKIADTKSFIDVLVPDGPAVAHAQAEISFNCSCFFFFVFFVFLFFFGGGGVDGGGGESAIFHHY